MKTLRIAKELEFPIDAVTQKLAWLGRTGSGKTFGAKRMVEQMLRIGAQVVILDPVGVWPGLRLGPKSFDVPVLGGLYGDIPLEPTAGVVIADLVVDHATSMVIDVSQMIDAERTRFATAFGQRFFQRKKASPSAVHLVLEECQEFVPENHQKGEERMLHEFQRIAKLGRNFGIGLSLISQRPQEISKKALNQAECVFAFQMTGPQERKALEYWLNDKGFNAKLSDVLPRLEIGAPYVWSPQWLKVSEVVHILPIDSLDTSSTPKVGEKAFAQAKLKPIDLKAISAAMAETVERAKADDPKALRARVAELERELAKKQSPKPEPVPVAVPAFDEEGFGGLFEAISTLVDSVSGHAAEAKGNIGKLLVAFRNEQRKRVAQTKAAPTPAKKIPLTDRELREAVRPPASRPVSNGTGTLKPSEHSLLRAIHQFSPVSLARAAVIAGHSANTSTMKNAATSLRAQGFVLGANSSLAITKLGEQESGPLPSLPTGDALLEHWCGKLKPTEAGLLRAIVAALPEPISLEEACSNAGLDHEKSTAKNAATMLRHLALTHGSNNAMTADESLVS